MKTFNDDQIAELCSAVSALEKSGRRFLIDYGYDNAVRVAKELGLFVLEEQKPIITPSWDEIFMREVYLWASKSKDPRTKIGAVLVKDNIPISHGYNGFARNVKDDTKRYNDRPTKYKFVVHAEDNTVLNCARRGISSVGSTLYTQCVPCCECAKSIIQGGITDIVVHNLWPTMNNWEKSQEHSKVMFDEVGIKIRVFSYPLGIEGFNDGKIISV